MTEIGLGHNPDEDSRWNVVFSRQVTLTHKKDLRNVGEILCKDQWNNYLICYDTLIRRDRYTWHDWVRPSMWDVCGGWTDNLFNHYRKKAMEAFQVSERALPRESVKLGQE